MPYLDCACHSGGAYQPQCSIPGGCGSAGCNCTTPGASVRLTPIGSGEPCPECGKVGDHTHCLACDRRDRRPDRVCQPCRNRGDVNLADLPDLMRRLELALVPTQGVGERVTSSSAHSSPGARLEALNLRTSSALLDADHPDWYAPPREPDPGDDRDGPMQYGTLSIPTWTRLWARSWRMRHNHHISVTPAAGRMAAPEGIADDDPLAQQWQARHGTPIDHHGVARDAEYLRTWLETACNDPDLHPDVGDMLRGLKRLHKAATVLLGGKPVDVYCGRCPEARFDKTSGEEEVCGTNLWSDPYCSVIICPRCKAETRRQDLLRLRARQLDRWTETELSQPATRGAA